MNNYDKTLFGEHEERIEAFEAELAGGRLVRLGDFLPDHHHPDYVATLQELVRITDGASLCIRWNCQS